MIKLLWLYGLLISTFVSRKVYSHFSYPQKDVFQIESADIEAVFNSNHYWIIKFYSPECYHCKKVWSVYVNLKDNIQKENKGKVFFGEVNCSSHRSKDICKKHNILQIPQFKIFKGPELLSTYSYFVNEEVFLKKWIYYVTTPIFLEIESEEELQNYKTDDVRFLTCSKNLPTKLIEVAQKYHEEHYFLNVKNETLCESKGIKPNKLFVDGLYEHETFDFTTEDKQNELLKSFIRKNRFHILNKMDHYNFFNIRSNGAHLILLILNSKKPHSDFISKFKDFAKKYRKSNDFIFGYIDGITYEENLEFYGINRKKLPQIMVFSSKPKEYFLESYFSLDTIDNIIDDILNERIQAKPEEMNKTKMFFMRFKKSIESLIDIGIGGDYVTFAGLLFSLILVLFTLIMLFRILYKFVNKNPEECIVNKKRE